MLANQMSQIAEARRIEQTRLFIIDLQKTISIMAESGYNDVTPNFPINVNKCEVEKWLKDNGFKIDRSNKVSW